MSRVVPGAGFLIAGGGTAGHVSPGLAVAEALAASGHRREVVHFVGSTRGMEGQLVPEAGFTVSLFPGRGFKRKLAVENLLAFAELAAASLRAMLLVARRRPAAVVAVAGYASVPTSLAAWLFGVPIIVVNIDAVPGAANRLVGRVAAACAVARPGTVLPRAVVTGAPVRADVLAIDRSPHGRETARAKLGIAPGRFVVVVTGGSLGARTLNDAAVTAARLLEERADLTIYHVAGRRDHAAVAARVDALGLDARSGLDYRLVGFEPAMATVLAAADVVVARAGASTVAELTVAGIASILVPLPGAPGDHQRRNTDALLQGGAALVVDDADCTGALLAELVTELSADRSRITTMEAGAIALGPRDAAARVAALVDEVVERRGAARAGLGARLRTARLWSRADARGAR